MSIYEETTANRKRAYERVVLNARNLCKQAGRSVVFVDSRRAVRDVRMLLADDGAESLAIEVTTVGDWVADRCELFGDGRAIVSMLQRHVALAATGKQLSSGTIRLLAGLAKDFLPAFSGGAWREHDEVLTPGERDVCIALESYAASLHARGLVEPCEAAALLAEAMPLGLAFVWLKPESPVLWKRDLLDALALHGQAVFVRDTCLEGLERDGAVAEIDDVLARLPQAERTDVGAPVQARGAVRTLLPTGQYALPNVLLQAILEERDAYGAQGLGMPSIVVVSRDAAELYERLSRPLEQQGVLAATSSRAMYIASPEGAGIIGLLSLLVFPNIAVEQAILWASDFVYSPVSGMSQHDAAVLDAQWRSKRVTTVDSIIASLAEKGSVAARVCAANNETGILAAAAELQAACAVLCGGQSGASKSFAYAAKAYEVLAEADIVGLSAQEALMLLAEMTAQLRQSNGSDVVFTTLEQAAEGAPMSYDVLMICDLSSDVYPARARDGADLRLLAKLGIDASTDELAEQRLRFAHALSTAKTRVWVGRVLKNADGDETYPAMVLEEFFDTYRPDPTNEEDLDKQTRIPKVLLPWMTTWGEDAVQENEALGAEGCERAWKLGDQGELASDHRQFILLPRASQVITPVVSPSALEDYLACPYRWFTNRRLRIKAVDAQFGPLEMGNVAHDVLRAFYEALHEGGQTRVTQENLDDAIALLKTTFDQIIDKQITGRISYDPLVARTELEEHQVAQLKQQLVDFVRRDASFLPSFAPAHIEYRISSDANHTYAGCVLAGQVDRIDVNENGQAVIVDYKGSLSDEYALIASSELEGTSIVLPHRIQTLVYAQMVRKILGLDVVGALYVSYGRKPFVYGAYDPAHIGPADIGQIAPKKCSIAEVEAYSGLTFSQLLDTVEERIEQGIQPMLDGHIVPSPRGADPCRYCPVTVCKRRK